MKARLQAEELEARDTPAAGSTLVPVGVGADFTLSVNTYGRVATMQMAAPDWLNWLNGRVTAADVQAMARRIYQYFPDQFDQIFFVNNVPDVSPTSPYFGVNFGVQNKVSGIGRPIFDNTAQFGSAGKLQSAIHLASEKDLRQRTSLHEFLHLSANFLPELQTTVPSHWGFASVGGQLGGWAPGTLEQIGPGLYNADGPNGNDAFFPQFADVEDGNVPYAQLELYLLGLIEAEQIDPLQYATTPRFTNAATGEFTATSIQTVTYQNILAGEGRRLPSPATSQKDFRVLTVVMTPNPLTQAELDQFDTDVELFGRKGSDGDPTLLNFFEATGGRATLSMEGLDAFIPRGANRLVGVGAEGNVLLGYAPTGQGTIQNTVTLHPDLSAFFGPQASVRTAVGDVDGDNVPDFAFATGPGVPTRFGVLSGDGTRYIVPPTAAFVGSPEFTGGAFVSAGDLDGDGREDVIVSADLGGGPRVIVYSFKQNTGLVPIADFFGIADANFRGGARTAVGDVNRDGTPDLAVAAGPGGGPRIALYDGAALFTTRAKLVNDFFAFDPVLRDGANVAIGDVNGDGFGDLVFGAGAGGAPRVLILNGQRLLTSLSSAFSAPVANFFVDGDTTSRGGARVATKNIDGDERADVVVGSGPGMESRVVVYKGLDLARGFVRINQDVDPFGTVLAEGVFVG